MFAGSIVLLLCLAGLAYRLRGRRDPGPAAFWTWAWLSVFGSGVIGYFFESRTTLPFSYTLGALFVVLTLAGTLSWADRRIPHGLVAAAIVFGCVRASLAGLGFASFADGLALALEPAGSLIAAWVAFQNVRAPGTRPIARLMVPGLIAVALLDALSAGVRLSTGELTQPVLLGWGLIGGLVFALEVTVASLRTRDRLQRARDELSVSVVERTAELQQAITSLENEVNERAAAEERLRGSEERYRLVSELSSDYSFALRLYPDMRMVGEWVTDAIRPITGYRPEALAEHASWASLVHPDDRAAVDEHVRAALAGELVEMEHRILTPDGDVRWISSRMMMVSREPDGSARLVGAVTDVTHRRVAEEERRGMEIHLREAERLKSLGVLAGGVAHDFNNLLTAILGNARVLLDDTGTPTAMRSRLELIRSAGEQAAGLTEQMLTYSGDTQLELVPLDLSRLIADMSGLLGTAASDFAQLELDLAEDLPPTLGDPAQLRQVAINLVTNASEALSGGRGRIIVRTSLIHAEAADLTEGFGDPDPQPGPYVMLEVEDTGVGLSEEQRVRAFEPFFTTKFTGRGLGLASVLGIVCGHGGVISIDSKSGVGTTVRVLLRTADAANRSLETRVPVPDDVGGRVLVVDDDEAVLELAALFLERSGFQVTAVLGGLAAVDRFVTAPDDFDAVVLDLAMPDLSGEQVFRRLRELRPDIPVILASGYGEMQAAARFGDQGLAGFVRKPFEPEDLVRALTSALGN